ncbi:MAG: capsule assembly Wzi family protein [Bacteroidales bacterium]|nr:capsule assembly Wzi family protein [Bacteroidales bacterium]
MYYLFFISNNAFNQNVIKSNLETGFSLANGKTPFWMVSGQEGQLSVNKYNQWIKGEVSAELTYRKNIKANFKTEVIDVYNSRNQFYFNQAYGKLSWKFISIQGGLKSDVFGNQDSLLSCGSLILSDNARPLPKIGLLVNEFTPVPFSRNFIKFKGGIEHGWFGKNQFVDNALLHHKFFCAESRREITCSH